MHKIVIIILAGDLVAPGAYQEANIISFATNCALTKGSKGAGLVLLHWHLCFSKTVDERIMQIFEKNECQ